MLNVMKISTVGETSTATITQSQEDYCDCEKFCVHCGKKKRKYQPYVPTYPNYPIIWPSPYIYPYTVSTNDAGANPP